MACRKGGRLAIPGVHVVSLKAKRLVTSRGTVEYASVGSGAAILFIHGAGGGFDQGQNVASRYGTLGYRVVSVSRFGYKGTPIPSDASLESQADTYADVLDALAIRDVTLLAVSAGASSALEFAVRHTERVKALILVVPAAYRHAALTPGSLRPVERYLVSQVIRYKIVLKAICRFFPRAVIKTVFATPSEVWAAASSADRSRMLEMVHGLSLGGLSSGGLKLDVRLTIYPEMERLTRVNSPALVITAADDLYRTMDNARHIARLLANSRLIIFQSGGHLLVGRDRHLSQEIDTFLGQHMPAHPP